ncbi:zinc-binding alcohol dehydrogenase family protein [Evansella sp. AB-rgal1]|uniref:zinc-binding alcohol dehydrogenase family protein n=1 Tax=Evansella sp. AB-rgal1 TaxID=3242696 RepID=UPI00359D8ED9
MKSIVCVQPNELLMTDEQVPSLVEGEALVQIKRIGICGTDQHAYKGNQPYFTYPRVLGHELSGIVMDIDPNVKHLKKGDQVAIIPYLHCENCIACKQGKTNCCEKIKVIGVHEDGGMREVLSVPTSHLLVTNNLSLDAAALLEPLAIGAHAVRRAEIKRGENVLVIGAGPIGLGIMVFARDQGANVIAMDVNEERLQFCKKWGEVGATVNALHQPIEELLDVTDGNMPSVVIDATGNLQSMKQSFHYISHGGKLVYVGLVKDDISFYDPDFHKRETTLLGSRNATIEDFEYVQHVLAKGEVDIPTYITHRCSFEDMMGEFENWLQPESKVIKAIVEL